MIVFSPTFGKELIAAGLGGLPFCWSDDGTIQHRDQLTVAQNTTLDTVIAAHNPAQYQIAVTQKAASQASYESDPRFINLLAQLDNATAAQIANFVNNNSAADAGTKDILIRILLILGSLI